MTFEGFKRWVGHPFFGFFISSIFAPAFVLVDMTFLISLPAIALGLIHEAGQYFFGWGHWEDKFNWLDVLDFSIGGAWMTAITYLIVWAI